MKNFNFIKFIITINSRKPVKTVWAPGYINGLKNAIINHDLSTNDDLVRLDELTQIMIMIFTT